MTRAQRSLQNYMHELSKACILALSFFSRIPGYRVGCYYCLFQQEKLLSQTASTDSEQKSSEYVVCFLGGSEKGLELYPFFGLWGYQEGNAGRQVEDYYYQPLKSLSTSYALTSISYRHMTSLSSLVLSWIYFWPLSLCDLGSPTRDWNWALRCWEHGVLTLVCQEIPMSWLVLTKPDI